MSAHAHIGSAIFDGKVLHEGKALLVDGGIVRRICTAADLPAHCKVVERDGGTLMPGFVDLQVNGGGGAMFNEATSLHGLSTIAKAHARTGTRAFLPTLITDTPDRTRAAVDAVAQAIAAGVPGVVGLHLEGPHLSIARKGAHDPALIRPMTCEDAKFLVAAAARLPNLMVTVAPENVSTRQIAKLVQAGVIVALGHSDCSFDVAREAFEAGARVVTHLFNAMSQMGHREPGLAGAALHTGSISAGLIADSIHVHAATMRIALEAKQGPGEVFLVTDAMATVGSEIPEFHLNGRRVLRRDGRLTLTDGTLAGADLEMLRALKVIVTQAGLPASRALRMATGAPARCLRQSFGFGTLIGAPVDHVILVQDGFAQATPL